MATHRRDATAGHLGYFSVGQALKVVQDNDGPLGKRQRREGVGDRVHGKVALGLGGGPGDGIGGLIEKIDQIGAPAAGDLIKRRRVTIWYSQVENEESARNRARFCHAAIRASWAMSSASWWLPHNRSATR